MRYKALHNINKYLSNRKIDIETNRYDQINSYISNLKPYQVENADGNLGEYTSQYFYSDNDDRMLLQIYLIDKWFRVSYLFVDHIKSILGKNTNGNIETVLEDIINTHFNCFGIKLWCMDRFIGEEDYGCDTKEESLRKMYDRYSFKPLSEKEYEDKIDSCKNVV